MKSINRIVLWATCLFYCNILMAQTPVAYYPFNGNANDATGTLNGTVHGAALTTDRFGNANSAYSFDGVDDFIDIGNLNFANNDYTISFWVNMNSDSTENTVFSGADPAALNNSFVLAEVNNGTGRFLHRNPSGITGGVNIFSNQSFSLGLWKFITCVKQGTVLTYFINGIMENTITDGGVTNINSAINIEFGRLRGGEGAFIRHLNGKLDEVKIYNVALTALQVQQEYASSSQLQKPGSGNAISFDGSTQSVSIPNITAINFGTGDFSLGFWYNSANNGKAEIVFEKRDDNCGDGQNWSIRKAADQIYLEVNVPGPTSDVVTIPNAADGKWHHIVFTRTATQLNGFKDGVLIASTNATAQNVNNSAPIQIATGPCSPFFPGGNGFFNGRLDEIQFWNAALTQTQIRDRMCKKITNSDPLYSNLVAYFNFDESTGNIVFDGTFNANNGSLINNPTRLTSGAPIGNTSTYDYSGASSTAHLTHPTRGDIFASTLSAGDADGLQLYCVTEDPNTTNGQTVLSNNNSYFGVFAVNGTNEPFATVYHYNGIDLNGNPQNKLLLYQRADNAAATWLKTSAVLDSNTHTLSATSSSTEYMVGLNNTQAIFKPGSGNAISFDGFTQSVSIPNSAAGNFGSGNFSVEFWLNSSGTDRDEILMSKRDDGCGDGQLWGIYKIPAGSVYLELHNPGNINQRISVPNVLDGKWHHLSFIRNGTQLLGFRDGIQVDNHSATPINVNNSAALTIATGACAPFIAGGGLFEGKIDEFEIWNIALSQSELRDRMCHKITSSDTLFSNLVAYYNFDESSGTTAFDGTVNANNGNLANNPARVTSGAPIGNASNHDYSNTIKAASITQANGESITITSTTGNPDGIQLYSVNEQPNTLGGVNAIGSSDAYFGVFQVNGTNPQYTAVYNYLGNPAVTALNEANLQLYNRADNAATSWAPLAAVPNTTAKTITVSGEHTEYLLGKTDIALPLTLLAFTAAKQNNSVQLKWTTRNEINTASFVVERSNGNNNFTAIGQVKASGHMAGAAYQLLDAAPFTTGATQYYRLKMIDNDGRWLYSNFIKINSNTQTIVSVYPNPASAVIIINSHKNQQGIITNAAGQTMRTITLINGSQTLHIAQWPAGLYLLKTQDQVIKIIKNQ